MCKWTTRWYQVHFYFGTAITIACLLESFFLYVESLHVIDSSALFSCLPSPGQPPSFFFISINLTILGTSYMEKITQHLSFWSWLISLPLSVFTFHSPLCMSESPSLLRLKILYCTDTHTDYRMSAEQIGCFSLSSHHESCCYKHGHTHVPLISRNSKWASKRINEWMTTPIFRELRGGQPDWEMLGKKRWEREGAISLMILCKAGADQNLVCVSLCNGLWCYLSKSALLWVHKSLLH